MSPSSLSSPRSGRRWGWHITIWHAASCARRSCPTLPISWSSHTVCISEGLIEKVYYSVSAGGLRTDPLPGCTNNVHTWYVGFWFHIWDVESRLHFTKYPEGKKQHSKYLTQYLETWFRWYSGAERLCGRAEAALLFLASQIYSSKNKNQRKAQRYQGISLLN